MPLFPLAPHGCASLVKVVPLVVAFEAAGVGCEAVYIL